MSLGVVQGGRGNSRSWNREPATLILPFVRSGLRRVRKLLHGLFQRS
jgi:hypothetical protein